MTSQIIEIILPFIIFFVLIIITTVVMMFLPFLIGRTMPPAYSISDSSSININAQDLYNLLTNYNEYTKWKRHIKDVAISKDNNDNTVWTEHNKRFGGKHEFVETKKVEPSLLIFSSSTDEYANVVSYIIEPKDEYNSKLTIKETVYLYHPYLRFFSRILFSKMVLIKNTFRQLRKYSKRINND